MHPHTCDRFEGKQTACLASRVWSTFAQKVPPGQSARATALDFRNTLMQWCGGTLFLPWNQVDLIFGKSGQPVFGPLYFKLGPDF